MKRYLLSALLIALLPACLYAQDKLVLPKLSPTTKISQEFSLSQIDISYSRPSMRGRKIFGDVVPFGRAWRTGANSPTSISIGENLEIGGRRLKAGDYKMYTIPGKESWEVIISSATGPMGAEGFPKEYDMARFKITPLKINEAVQTFTIAITDIEFTSCKIELSWENTKIVIPVIAKNEEAIKSNIDAAINKTDKIPYFQIAAYYYATDQKLELANKYVDKAIDQNPKAYYMWYLKARIERELGHIEEGLAAARKSIELSEGSSHAHEYKHNNQKIIDALNKKKRYYHYAE